MTDFYSFDPNNPVASDRRWGVWDGAQFTMHEKRGGAISKFLAKYQAKLYHFDTQHGFWIEVASLDADKRDRYCNDCTLCGASTFSNYGIHSYARWGFEKQNGRIVDPLNLVRACGSCRVARRA